MRIVVSLSVWTVLALASDGKSSGNGIEPARGPGSTLAVERQEKVEWAPLLRESGMFMAIQHSFRLATEPGTRQGLRGPFWSGYSHAAGNLHGWSDGDPFYVNFVGHPMQGAVSGYLFVAHDPRYRRAEIGKDPAYWKSRARALGYAFAYSTQFEIGPLSEASVGNIQSRYPQYGFVDHVVTPLGGLVWMMAEDALDRFVIKPVENRTGNTAVRILMRGALNPARSFSSVLGGKVPWYRTTRSGIYSYGFIPEPPKQPARRDTAARVERFSLTAPVMFRRVAGLDCLGSGGRGVFRVSSQWDIAVDVNGCKMLSLGAVDSGDSLVYQVGPRWRPRGSGRWNPYVEVLAGGHKVTRMREDPDKKRELLPRFKDWPATAPPLQYQFSQNWESNGFALSMGGGIDLGLSRALALNLANVQYLRSWMPPVLGASLDDGFRASLGMTLRFGTW